MDKENEDLIEIEQDEIEENGIKINQKVRDGKKNKKRIARKSQQIKQELKLKEVNYLKKTLQRTCMGCNEKKEKDNLIRIVKNKKNEIKIDKTGKEEGRGAYICNKMECLDKVIKNKRIERAFKKQVEKNIYEDLRGVIIDRK